MINNPTSVTVSKLKEAYISFGDKNKAQAISSLNQVIDVYEGVKHSSTNERAVGISLTNDQTIRAPFNRIDYDIYRPHERLPQRFREIIHVVRSVYLRLGIVRQVIDMMTDFATEDLRIIHPDKKTEAFFKVWAKKVKLYDVVEEFVRHLLIDANVVVRRTTARLTKPVESQWMETTTASGVEKLYTEDKANKREIPWTYTFLNVAALQWIGGDIGDGKQLAFRPSAATLSAIRSPTDPLQQNFSDRIPLAVKETVQSKNGLLPLDMSNIYVSYNKKDSWEDWAAPSLYSILSEVFFRDKLRQAENSALDGVINVIRLWKLGDHKEGILPNQAVVDKLVSILDTNTGGGSIDLVWDSMIDMEPFYPPINEILGPEKYEQVNRDILIGLGVPEVLVGGEGGNFSNSFIQLKTMVQKLNYVRNKVIEWLDGELKLVCDAMNINILPRARFNQENLEDQNANRKLILGLLDRGIISAETVLKIYGEDFMMELARIPQEKSSLKKAGIEVKSPFDVKAPDGGGPQKTGNTGKGRPSGVKDSSVRDTRTAKPKRSLAVFALDAIDIIDKVITPIYITSANISNARKLTTEQRGELNNIRIIVLSCIKPSDTISEATILDIAENSGKYNKDIINNINIAISDFIEDRNVEPTLSQRKNIEAVAWAEYNEENTNGEN